jgi:hypothetical protein
MKRCMDSACISCGVMDNMQVRLYLRDKNITDMEEIICV